MQDPNNENTKPTRLNRNIEDTVPSRITSQPQTPPEEAVTQQIPVQQPAEQTTVAVSTPAPETMTLMGNQLPEKPAKKSGNKKRWLWILAGILIITVFVAAGGWIGYRSALQLRQTKMNEMRQTVAKDHFMAGLVAQSNQQYEIAKLQFEEVIRQDPTFPGAEDKLREVLLAMAIVNTPTLAPTVALPTLTPTPDTRPQEEIFNQALMQYAAKDWAGLFISIDSMRRIDPNFHAVEIDGMQYIALRFRGIDKILLEANLEGGLYDLALAERFGPLDVDALGYRNWARLYLNGASFWDADWERVMQYFEEIYPYFPNMRDSSGMTASERYRIAARNQGDKLMIASEPCTAYEFYQKSLNVMNDNDVATKADQAFQACHPPEPTATPTLTVTVTPTVGSATLQPTAPAVEPTAPPQDPSQTPTP